MVEYLVGLSKQNKVLDFVLSRQLLAMSLEDRVLYKSLRIN